MPPRSRPTPPRDSLVVSPACDFDGPAGGGRIGGFTAGAEGEVVGAALGGGAGVEGFEDDVDDALGSEDVAAADGGGAGGGEEGAFGDAD